VGRKSQGRERDCVVVVWVKIYGKFTIGTGVLSRFFAEMSTLSLHFPVAFQVFSGKALTRDPRGLHAI